VSSDPRSTKRTRPTGRRTGDSSTRADILDAARTLFAELGYDGASLRAIASAAQVDPALIRHFFGDKETLFATTFADRTTIPDRMSAAVPGDPEGLGERVTDIYLRLWEDLDTRPILLSLVRSATTSERAAAMLSEILGGRARGASIPDVGSAGVAIAASHLLGVAVARHVIKLPAITGQSHDDLVASIAPTIQRYLTSGDSCLSTTASSGAPSARARRSDLGR
jgi:AcrR family transcriptional regulator